MAAALAQWITRSHRWRRQLADARPLPIDDLPPETRAIARSAIAHGIALKESDALPVPLAFGLLHPSIVLPSALRARLDDSGLRFVLLHELAHVRRGDLWTTLLLRVVRSAWFFHPAPWIAGRVILREREQACDDAALADFAPPARASCAEAFLKVVEFSRGAAADLAGGAALANEVSQVRSRIMRMVDERGVVARHLSKSGALLIGGAALAVLALQQPARSSTAAPQDAPSPQAPTDPLLPSHASLLTGVWPTRHPERGDTTAKRTAAAKQAIVAAGRWLATHQEPTGHWDADGFDRLCHECDGHGGPANDIGVTSLATMALMAAETNGESAAAAAIDRASAFLLSVQDKGDGCIGAKSGQHFMYGHMLASLALGKLEARARDLQRGKTLQQAVDFILRARNPYQAWRYSAKPDGDNDSSVTAFALLALACAMENGVAVDAAAIDDGFKFTVELRDPKSGRTGYQTQGSPSARSIETMELWLAEQVEAITAAVLHARFADDKTCVTAADAQQSLALVAMTPPRWDQKSGTIDFYYWWHGTCAMKVAGGDRWIDWRKNVWNALLRQPQQEGHRAGSFSPRYDPWGMNGGRVYSTAICLLTLAETVGARSVSGREPRPSGGAR